MPSASMVQAPSPSVSATVSAVPDVGVLLPDGFGRWSALARALRTDLDRVGIRHTMILVPSGASAMTQGVQSLADAGVGQLVIAGMADGSTVEAISLAKRLGMRIVEIGRLTPSSGVDAAVVANPEDRGRMLGNGLVRCLSGNGVVAGPVMLINGPEESDEARLERARSVEVIRAAGYSIADEAWMADPSATEASDVFRPMYADANGDLVGVIAMSDHAAEGVISVLNGNAQAGKVSVAGMGASPQTLQQLIGGSQCVTVIPSVQEESRVGVELIHNLLAGERDAQANPSRPGVNDLATDTAIPVAVVDSTAIYVTGVPELIAQGWASPAEVCATDELKGACAERGIR